MPLLGDVSISSRFPRDLASYLPTPVLLSSLAPPAPTSQCGHVPCTHSSVSSRPPSISFPQTFICHRETQGSYFQLLLPSFPPYTSFLFLPQESYSASTGKAIFFQACFPPSLLPSLHVLHLSNAHSVSPSFIGSRSDSHKVLAAKIQPFPP